MDTYSQQQGSSDIARRNNVISYFKIVYTPLLIISIFMWFIDYLLTYDNWQCLYCRAKERIPATPVPQFLAYHSWSLWLTTIIFLCWAYGTPQNVSTRADRIIRRDSIGYNVATTMFQIALPLANYVMLIQLIHSIVTSIIYTIDTDHCYHLFRAYLSKAISNNPTTINSYLTLQFIHRLTVYFFSAPYLNFLYATGELRYQDDLDTVPFLPPSVIFVAAVGMIMFLLHKHDADTVLVEECGNTAWVHILVAVVLNFIYHLLFFKKKKKKKSKKTNNQDSMTSVSDEEGIAYSYEMVEVDDGEGGYKFSYPTSGPGYGNSTGSGKGFEDHVRHGLGGNNFQPVETDAI